VNLQSFRWVKGTRTFPKHVLPRLREEVENLQLTKLVAGLATAAMPHLCFSYLRTQTWRAAGLKIGERSRLLGTLQITGRASWKDQLVIGADTVFTGPIRVDIEAPVVIGDRVRIGPDVMLLTVDHRIGERAFRCGGSFARPIAIADGVWIGARALILPGVSIGAGAVVAAGAVVTHDVPADSLVAGVPARVIRTLSEAAPPSGERAMDDATAPDSVYRPQRSAGLSAA
jgi:maltose O-acetyltransferase